MTTSEMTLFDSQGRRKYLCRAELMMVQDCVADQCCKRGLTRKNSHKIGRSHRRLRPGKDERPAAGAKAAYGQDFATAGPDRIDRRQIAAAKLRRRYW